MSLLDDLKQIQRSASQEFGVGQEEVRKALFDARTAEGAGPEAPRFSQMKDAYRTPQALKAAFGGEEDPIYREARNRAGIGFDVSTTPKKVGTALGAVGADLTQDSLRRFYWLLNAAQATGDMIAETAISRARPALEDATQNPYTASGAKRPEGKKKKFQSDLYAIDKLTGKRKYGPGLVQLAAVPAGVAINTGLGLLTPFGGAEGYKAALPSEEDPTKTSNVLGEVALKYFMGRTGNLLPYDEFVKVRPDVSREEYGRYKAFKHDKKEDYNPFDDGKTSMFAGALRTTDEGIHGPEVQFLGRSLPVTTGIVPFAGAVLGAGLGVSRVGPKTGDSKQTPNPVTRQFGSDKPIRRGAVGGMVGLLAGQVVGSIIENERRRRNTVENELDGTLS